MYVSFIVAKNGKMNECHTQTQLLTYYNISSLFSGFCRLSLHECMCIFMSIEWAFTACECASDFPVVCVCLWSCSRGLYMTWVTSCVCEGHSCLNWFRAGSPQCYSSCQLSSPDSHLLETSSFLPLCLVLFSSRLPFWLVSLVSHCCRCPQRDFPSALCPCFPFIALMGPSKNENRENESERVRENDWDMQVAWGGYMGGPMGRLLYSGLPATIGNLPVYNLGPSPLITYALLAFLTNGL